MKIKFDPKNHVCIVTKEPTDPRFKTSGWADGESTFLYHVKQQLNKRGYDFIKKRMWKDGHLVDEQQQYLRERKTNGKRCLAIWNSSWAIEGAEKTFEEMGSVTLTVYDLNSKD